MSGKPPDDAGGGTDGGGKKVVMPERPPPCYDDDETSAADNLIEPEKEKNPTVSNTFLQNVFVDVRRQTTESFELSPLGKNYYNKHLLQPNALIFRE